MPPLQTVTTYHITYRLHMLQTNITWHATDWRFLSHYYCMLNTSLVCYVSWRRPSINKVQQTTPCHRPPLFSMSHIVSTWHGLSLHITSQTFNKYDVVVFAVWLNLVVSFLLPFNFCTLDENGVWTVLRCTEKEGTLLSRTHWNFAVSTKTVISIVSLQQMSRMFQDSIETSTCLRHTKRYLISNLWMTLTLLCNRRFVKTGKLTRLVS